MFMGYSILFDSSIFLLSSPAKVSVLAFLIFITFIRNVVFRLCVHIRLICTLGACLVFNCNVVREKSIAFISIYELKYFFSF